MKEKAKTRPYTDTPFTDVSGPAKAGPELHPSLQRIDPDGRGRTPAMLERRLGLAPGAWRRRRLWTLGLRDGAFGHLGLGAGDLLVIEPGAREQAGQLVLTRKNGLLELQRLPRRFDVPEGATGLLPFPAAPRIVGSVVARVPATSLRSAQPARTAQPAHAEQADRSGAPGIRRIQGLRTRKNRSASARAAAIRRQRILTLEQRLESWRGMGAAAGDHGVRLEHNLATLLECARRAQGARMTDALLDQADAVARMMGQSIAARRRPVQTAAPTSAGSPSAAGGRSQRSAA